MTDRPAEGKDQKVRRGGRNGTRRGTVSDRDPKNPIKSTQRTSAIQNENIGRTRAELN